MMFHSIDEVKKTIIKELCDNCGDDMKVDVRYFQGHQSAKIWLISNEDMRHMYSVSKGEVSMWAECSKEERSSSSDDSEDEAASKKK